LNANAKEGTYKIMGGKFNVPQEFRGRENAIAIYDVSGKLLQKSFVKRNCIAAHFNHESANAVFIVRVTSN
jgi:hypothetical protein